jgi:hypothetical protein
MRHTPPLLSATSGGSSRVRAVAKATRCHVTKSVLLVTNCTAPFIVDIWYFTITLGPRQYCNCQIESTTARIFRAHPVSVGGVRPTPFQIGTPWCGVIGG